MLEILCTVSGAIAGSAIVASLMQHHSERNRPLVPELSNSEESVRLNGLADQLVTITNRVSADVSAHTVAVNGISERLRPSAKEPKLVFAAISELVEVNEAVQMQLAEAQQLLSQQSQQIEAASREARTDVLTGLSNRRALDEFMAGCVQPAPPEDISALLMLDIDHFKGFNDTYGHSFGDAVLAQFARGIAEWCDGKYYAARYGGEEFAVIITGKSMALIAQKAASLRTYVSEKPIAHDDLNLSFTCSGGLAPFVPGDTVQEAYKRADQGLFMAKRSGRNCGYWLKADQWVPFESAKGESPRNSTGAGLHPDAMHSTPEVTPASAEAEGKTASQAWGAQTARLASKGYAEEGVTAGELESRSDHSDDNGSSADVLDPVVFLQRLEVHLTQLQRAALPATAIAIRAEGLEQLEPGARELYWESTLALVQLQVRGIDVVGHCVEHALCIFLPGTSLNTAMERAGRLQQGLTANPRTDKQSTTPPRRFSIALATAASDESPEAFMLRLETALATARDVRPGEIVVHDGKNCQVPTA